MEFNDLPNVKHIKVIATTGIATVAVATGTSPVMAHDNTSTQTSHTTSYSRTAGDDNDSKDCLPGQVKTSDSHSYTTAVQTKTDNHEDREDHNDRDDIKPAQATKPMKALPAVATPDKPAAITTAAVVTPPAPSELPKTGPEHVVAAVGLAAIGGYIANLFRLKRRRV